MIDKLKPCPFCGEKPELVKITNSNPWVKCQGCGVETGMFNTEQEAIEAWNRRVSK